MATIDELIEQLDSRLEEFKGPGPFGQAAGNRTVEDALEILLAIVKEMRKEKATTAKRPPPLQTVLDVKDEPILTYHKLEKLLKEWSVYLEGLADRLEKKVQED